MKKFLLTTALLFAAAPVLAQSILPNPTAAEAGAADGDKVTVATDRGEITIPLRIADMLRPQEICARDYSPGGGSEAARGWRPPSRHRAPDWFRAHRDATRHGAGNDCTPGCGCGPAA